MSKRLGFKPFKTWLENKPANDVVGTAGIGDVCPLAIFLYQQTGKTSQVGREKYSQQPALVKWHDMPGWAVCFVGRLDAEYDQQDVTAVQALSVLDKARHDGKPVSGRRSPF